MHRASFNLMTKNSAYSPDRRFVSPTKRKSSEISTYVKSPTDLSALS